LDSMYVRGRYELIRGARIHQNIIWIILGGGKPKK